MALKSYRLRGTMKKKKKKKSKGFIKNATGAIIGVALLSEVSGIIKRI